jgi:hypothetical protein
MDEDRFSNRSGTSAGNGQQQWWMSVLLLDPLDSHDNTQLAVRPSSPEAIGSFAGSSRFVEQHPNAVSERYSVASNGTNVMGMSQPA